MADPRQTAARAGRQATAKCCKFSKILNDPCKDTLLGPAPPVMRQRLCLLANG